jgi:hypothetical protein
MITNNGKDLISKYLLGQVPTYATHISIGCGATPLGVNDAMPNDIYGKEQMEFEMTRVPISSKGFVDNSVTYLINQKYVVSNLVTLTTSTYHDIVAGETVIISGVDVELDGQYRVNSIVLDGSSNKVGFTYDKVTTLTINPAVAVSPMGSCIVARTKLSLTAELPTENRYEISEIGVWSAGNNSLVTQYDSRMIFNFSQSWQLHGTSISDPILNTNLGFDGTTTTVDIQDTHNVLYANTNDPLFQVNTRKTRKEGPRHLNRTLLARGDLSTITYATLNGDWTASGEHIHLNDISFNITGNNSSDLLKLAFSLVDKTAVALAAVKNVKVLMEFYKNEITTTSGFAKAQIYIPGTDFETNRYNVTSWELSQNIDYSNQSALTTLPYTRFYTSPDFASSEIRVCRIFVAITKTDNSASTDHYLALDGFRIENTTENPTYKMSGYSIVRNDGQPVVKLSNTNNYVDFRFSLGVS